MRNSGNVVTAVVLKMFWKVITIPFGAKTCVCQVCPTVAVTRATVTTSPGWSARGLPSQGGAAVRRAAGFFRGCA